ncbi:hypothetical protein BST81_08235 [Leptolyngbya sp. 'hensonii']|uniref:carotenoid oxygenase family protein n=1 Tax=Leptolyngbya sp. 'hensonii' TaxID=1922337 RepID=UPI00094FCC58|nr:carotenoid oxygenase family protein [Leptolyngbya sp. 'hensonii']OLP18894.1 hypothetical protein BST81_08235 [Leptolyngbya sp. 'hensonii']
MVSLGQSPQTYTWGKAVTHTPDEFAATALPVLSGAIPAGLRGTLYRNGPARLELGGQRVGHWFDGDGAMLAIHFAAGGVTGTYRFVQTQGYQAEAKAGKFLFGGYGMTPPGPLWQRFSRGLAKNVANTSVLALPDKLLALWEGGWPYALNLQTLDTIGPDNLGGLSGAQGYSAHPKRDPQTGEIFNFAVGFGKTGTLHLYRSDRSGRIQQQGTITLDGLPLIHDFVLAGPYLVFLISPVHLNALPVLARLTSYGEALTWQPERGTQILVVDRNTLTGVSWGETEPWYQWHFGNGAVDESGQVVLDLVRYPDFQTNQFLKEVATGQTQTLAPGTLWRIVLDPQTATVREAVQVVDRACEFPSVNPGQVGQPWRYTYLSLHRRGAAVNRDLFGAIARFDHQTHRLTELDCGVGCYPMEPLFAPDPARPEQGWVLTVVYDGNRNSSEVWVLDPDRWDAGPLCRLALPQVIPLGFHGTWMGAG